MPSSSTPAGTSVAPHRTLDEFYSAPEKRSGFVNDLFDQAAPDYDWVSGVMSLWTDRSYRRQALRRAGLKPGMKLLDVASGTGLMIRAALELGLPPGDIAGVDPSRGMLDQNRHPVRLLQGRGETLPFEDAAVDFICMGYALRHVEDLRLLFREFRRVLRPEGRLLVLEITRPKGRMAFALTRFYMQRVVPRLVRLCRRNKATARLMEYYWATIAECVPPETILAAMSAEGFHDVRRSAFGPLLSDYTAKR
jgi:demethylmenaquinone methyltransferase/2-methoxy-6-polyprenyl-1,4-benzoquinol methylase